MKRGRSSNQSIKHGNQASKEHADDVRKSKALRTKRAKESEGYEWVRVKVDSKVRPWEGGGGYESFKSDLSGLGIGECFKVEGGITLGENRDASSASLKVADREDWDAGLMAAKKDFDHYHALQPRTWTNKGKEGKEGGEEKVRNFWVKKKINDREGVEGEMGRPDSDVRRETIDISPEASRAIQYMVERGRIAEANKVLDQIRLKKVQLFEEIYGRKALYAAEHTDSGQHHDDIWHVGIFEREVKTEGGKNKVIKDRIPFRNYGISVGACSWDRHLTVLKNTGMSESIVKDIVGKTWDAVQDDIALVKQRYNDDPRDLKLQRQLDSFVRDALLNADEKSYKRAHQDYAAWIVEGYHGGHLGKKKTQLEREKERIAKLEEELDAMKKLKRTLELDLEDERGIRAEVEAQLKRVTEWVGVLFRTVGAGLKALVNRKPAASEVFQKLEEVVEGKEIPLTAAELSARLQRQLKRTAKLEMEMENPEQPQ